MTPQIMNWYIMNMTILMSIRVSLYPISTIRTEKLKSKIVKESVVWLMRLREATF